jgi:predicted DNA-binding transcriptional regulator AlpA
MGVISIGSAGRPGHRLETWRSKRRYSRRDKIGFICPAHLSESAFIDVVALFTWATLKSVLVARRLEGDQMPLVRMIRQNEVLTVTGWSRSTLRRRVSEGKFPKPHMNSKRMPQWFETDIAEYQQGLRDAAGLPALERDKGHPEPVKDAA